MVGERLKRFRELKSKFDAVHQQGMAGLRARDYSALDAAIREERSILEEQSALLKEEQEVIAQRRRGRVPPAGDSLS